MVFVWQRDLFFTSRKQFGVIAEVDFTLFRQVDGLQLGQSLAVVFGNDLFDSLFHMQAVVNGLNFFDFFLLIVVHAEGEEVFESFAVLLGG